MMTALRIGGARVVAGALVGFAGLLVLPAAPASAHAELVGSNPKDGATVQRLPTEVQLEFDEEVFTPAYVQVTASDGTKVGAGAPDVAGTTVTLPLTQDGPSGSYTVAYRVVSDDGHPVTGEITFDVTTGPPPASTADSGSSTGGHDDEGFLSRHSGHIAVAAVGVVAGVALVGLGLRARS
jgi:methionine-rich copper-binding protein CopC